MLLLWTKPLLLPVLIFLMTNDLSGADKCASLCDARTCPTPSCPGASVPDRCNCCLLCPPGEGEPCGRRSDLPCGEGLECRLLSAERRRGTCRCRSQQEVCGTDGNTYPSVCRLRAASRAAQHRGQAEVRLEHRGLCANLSSGHKSDHHSSPRFKFNFIADVVERIAPAVVHIELFVRHPLFGRHMRLSSGSGFIVTHTGVIVTNAHVVTTISPSVTSRPQLRVQLQDGGAYEAVLRDVDKKTDIATIKISPQQKKLPVLSLGPSSDLRPGEFVVAIGSPFALQNTVTTGIVSTAQRDGKELGIKDSDMDYIQTDAIINYGNSGGPLVNLDGEVIGINTLKVTAGISFAIPSDRISRFLTQSKIKHKKNRGSKTSRKKEKTRLQRYTSESRSVEDAPHVKRRFLGIKMLTITDDLIAELQLENSHFPSVSHGVLVQQVIPNSPAERGGLKQGDIIVKLNGQTVWSIEDIWEALQSQHPLLFKILRGHESLLFHLEPQE